MLVFQGSRREDMVVGTYLACWDLGSLLGISQALSAVIHTHTVRRNT